MKRRNADCGKLRRPAKRTKITEGIYGSTFVYVKFLMVWALVLMADFILEFRFEYLWPFWLLLRSVYDSFKYQGLAFSVFFICVAVTSDVVCYLFIPVQWLFFCASTYVWVQYVWHTERGICLPTVSLWLLFVYIEASIRLREIKTFPFNMDLCRPFAAHCIGYPVVTLGFGFKSYISYRFRLRKQKDVEKENEFYIHMLNQALPIEMQNQEKPKELPSSKEETISTTTTATIASSTPTTTTSNSATNNTNSNSQQNGSIPSSNSQSKQEKNNKSSVVSTTPTQNNKTDSISSVPDKHMDNTKQQAADKDLSNNSNSSSNNKPSKHSKGGNSNTASSQHIEDLEYIENSLAKKQHNVNSSNYEEENNLENERNSAKYSNNKSHNGVAGSGKGSGHHHHHSAANKQVNSQNNSTSTASSTAAAAQAAASANTASTHTHTSSSSGKKGRNNYTASGVYSNNKDDFIARMETDVKKLKADLQSSRNTEQELRSQLSSYSVSEKAVRSEIHQLQQDNESLQTKLHNLVTSRQQDKQNVTALEKKLQEERKTKVTLEQQLASERKAKKEEVAKASTRSECTEVCKSRRRELENDIQESRRQTMLWEGQTRQLERETQTLRQYKDAQSESEVLMSALAAMQDKNTHLENSLSAENRLKQDLFSALGEAKRQIEIHQGLLAQKDLEIAEMKVKMVEVISLMPPLANFPVVVSTSNNTGMPPLHFSGTFTPPPLSAASLTPPPSSPHAPGTPLGGLGCDMDCGLAPVNSSLNPNASDYTPKMSQ